MGVAPTLAHTLRQDELHREHDRICRDHPCNVKRWRDGQMALRWCAAGMGEAAKQFRRANGHLHLPRLRAALERHVAVENVTTNDHNHTETLSANTCQFRNAPRAWGIKYQFLKWAPAVTSPPLRTAYFPCSAWGLTVLMAIFGVPLNPVKSSCLQPSADQLGSADGLAVHSWTRQRTFCGLAPQTRGPDSGLTAEPAPEPGTVMPDRTRHAIPSG